jgi:hypothetical protein
MTQSSTCPGSLVANVSMPFGFSISWTMLFSYPLMAAIQELSLASHGIVARNRPRSSLPFFRPRMA